EPQHPVEPRIPAVVDLDLDRPLAPAAFAHFTHSVSHRVRPMFRSRFARENSQTRSRRATIGMPRCRSASIIASTGTQGSPGRTPRLVITPVASIQATTAVGYPVVRAIA